MSDQKQACPQDFLDRLKSDFPNDRLIFANTGLTAIEKDGKIIPIGCYLCYRAEKGQTSLGEPTLNGVPLKRGEDVANVVELSPEVASNLWLCPKCNMPVTGLLPKFNQESI